ncbi:amidase [Marinomonas epiphytica]
MENNDSNTSRSLYKTIKAQLDNIRLEDRKWHSVAKLFTEQALLQAKAYDKRMAKGGQARSLEGRSFLAKELFDIKGYATQFGSKNYPSEIASKDAACIARLKSCGAILLGTNNMVEFAIGSWGTNSITGTPWNPADPIIHRAPGGSSSGSAVSVAANMTSVAIGSDTGGSIRIPASLCGVIGFKPTTGLIPTTGTAQLGPFFDTIGPITRNVNDARLFTEAMAEKKLSHVEVSLASLRIATVKQQDLEPIDNEILETFNKAISRLKDLGVKIVELELPVTFQDFQKLNGDIVAYEIYQHIGDIADNRQCNIDPYIRQRVLAGKSISASEYQKSISTLKQLRSRMDRHFGKFDVIALPGTPICAPPITEIDENQIPMSRYTRIANCLDLCAISLPLGKSLAKLPIGWQLCAPANQDAMLLSLSQLIESDAVLGQELKSLD